MAYAGLGSRFAGLGFAGSVRRSGFGSRFGVRFVARRSKFVARSSSFVVRRSSMLARALHMRHSKLSRRQFLGVTLLGLTRKSGREIGGGFVHESHALGHRLRDGAGSPRRARHVAVPIVIVGGGIAGLSAAWRLRKRGAERFRAARDGARGRRQRAVGRERRRRRIRGPRTTCRCRARARRSCASSSRSSASSSTAAAGTSGALPGAAGTAVPPRTLAGRPRAAGRARPAAIAISSRDSTSAIERLRAQPAQFTIPDGARRARRARRSIAQSMAAWLTQRKASTRRGCAGRSTTRAATTTARCAGATSAWAGIHYFARERATTRAAHVAGGQRLDHQAPARARWTPS